MYTRFSRFLSRINKGPKSTSAKCHWCGNTQVSEWTLIKDDESFSLKLCYRNPSRRTFEPEGLAARENSDIRRKWRKRDACESCGESNGQLQDHLGPDKYDNEHIPDEMIIKASLDIMKLYDEKYESRVRYLNAHDLVWRKLMSHSIRGFSNSSALVTVNGLSSLAADAAAKTMTVRRKRSRATACYSEMKRYGWNDQEALCRHD